MLLRRSAHVSNRTGHLFYSVNINIFCKSGDAVSFAVRAHCVRLIEAPDPYPSHDLFDERILRLPSLIQMRPLMGFPVQRDDGLHTAGRLRPAQRLCRPPLPPYPPSPTCAMLAVDGAWRSRGPRRAPLARRARPLRAAATGKSGRCVRDAAPRCPSSPPFPRQPTDLPRAMSTSAPVDPAASFPQPRLLNGAAQAGPLARRHGGLPQRVAPADGATGGWKSGELPSVSLGGHACT